MQAPVIIVIGPPHHGKTEARKILAELTFQKGESTSTVIYSFLAHRRKVELKTLLAQDKETLRPDLIEAGDFLVGKLDRIYLDAIDPEIDKIVYRIPSGLVRTLYMSGHNIIDGVRRRTELSDSIKHLEWNGVRSLVIWVERPGYPTAVDNNELTALDAHEVVTNDGTLDELREKLKSVIEKHYGKQPDKHEPLPIFNAEGEPVEPPKEAEEIKPAARTSEL